MGIITFSISDEVEEKFRRKVAEIHGVARGVLSRAVEEAIELWIQTHTEKKKDKTQKR